MKSKILVTLAIPNIVIVSSAHSNIADNIETLLCAHHLPYKKHMTENWLDIDIKDKLHEFIEYSDNQDKLSLILERIIENPIGNITLRLLYQARQNMPKSKLKISSQSCVSAKDGKERYFGFVPTEFCVCLNLDKFEEAGTITYLNNKLFSCNPYEADSYLFHELLHSFHYTTGNYKGNSTSALQHIYEQHDELKKLWTNDEELYTISGKFLTKDGLLYDPLNCNLYEAYKQDQEKYPGYIIPQRIFHIRYTIKSFTEIQKLDWRYNLDKILTNFADLGF